MSGIPATTVQLTVTHGKSLHSEHFPVDKTLGEVKAWLERQTCVAAASQVLLFNAPVVKEYRRARHETDGTTLGNILPPSLVAKLEAATTPQIVQLKAMLIGTSQTSLAVQPVQLTAETAAVLSRVVSTTLEHDSRWFRCSYGQGYLRQTAYVCRTCVEEGRAAPDHALCLACTEVCHGNHNIEEWGVRYHMRCDCCTSKCWRPPTHPTAASAATPPSQEIKVIGTEDVEERTRRKRSRSRSPIKSPVGPGGSSVMGIRVPAVVNTPSPFSIDDPPGNEKEAVSSPILSTAAAGAGTRGAHTPPAVPQPSARVSATPEAPLPTPADLPPQAKKPAAQEVTPLPPMEGCRFILDNSTNRPPAIVIPPNARNRYPRDPLTWCYCKEEEPGDEDSGGLVCMICTTCFWNTHITSVHSEQFRRVPCYGDVVQGETVIFKCNTCDTHVCAPCRHRCHKDHDVEEGCLVTSELAQKEGSAPSPAAEGGEEASKTRVESTATGTIFSCGCRGLCSIAESISPHELEDPAAFLPFAPDTTNELMNSDIFTGFVCAHCMQEHPWLMTDDFRQCYQGRLPEKVTTNILPVLPCKAIPEERTEEEHKADTYFPYHGMILPVNAFTEEMLCRCGKCHEAFDKFVPWAQEDATHLMMNLCDQCDICHRSIRDKAAFLCQNCEMSMADPFMLCAECNAHREKLVEANQPVIVAQPLPGEEAPASPPRAPTVDPKYVNSEGTEVTYDHDLKHHFLEDTQENLYALCGMQVLNSLEPEDHAYLAEHWDEVQDLQSLTPEISLKENFGPTPIQLSQDELKEFAQANARGVKPSPSRGDA